MSSYAQPMIAPITSVTAPTISTSTRASFETSKIGCDRAMRYTPAVTIVAAWISAETGVGPSIASSNHDCNGTCALLPQAPSNSSRPSAVIVPVCALPDIAPLNTPSKATVPNVVNISITANDNPRSPTRLTRNAFLAATAALGLNDQKPISRYDARPTPSQPTYNTR